MKSILTFLILFSCFLIPAQPPTKFYTKFGGDGVDIGYGVKTTLDKNYIVVGSTTSYGAGSTDVYLVKVDSMGWPRWQTTFGGFGNDVGRSVIQLQDSSFVIAGFTNSYGAGGYDALIIKTDKNGTLLWQKTFGGIDWDFTYDLVEASDGNIVVVGNTSSFGSGNRDGLILKYDAAGTLLWQKFYGGVEDDEFKSIIKTNDGSLATVGYNKSQGDLNGNTYFVKLDLNGDTIFTKTYGGIYVDYGTDVIQKFFNNYFISGAKTYSANGHTESVMYEISPTGTQVNEAHFYASNNADESWIALTNSFAGPNHTAYLRQVPVPSYKIQGNLFVCQASLYPYLVNSFGGIEDESF
ncbi:MAG: hypothetical protein JWO32_2235, partial [Bacteroidetes bacterium]|nr:hypothetical protein [Bacteroidota bacterium]